MNNCINNCFENKKFISDSEITLESETFLNIDVSEDESLIEVEFCEVN